MGLIYKASNQKDGSAYIGATTLPLQERMRYHIRDCQRYPEYPFYKALIEFGLVAFTWEVIDTAESNDELREKEMFWIQNTTQPLYNQTAGGDGIPRQIWQYNVTGELLDCFDSVRQASREIALDYSGLATTCRNGTGYYGGYIWTYNTSYPLVLPKKIWQMKELDEVQTSYSSIAEAARMTGINKSSIAKVCRGERKTAGGYFWKKE